MYFIDTSICVEIWKEHSIMEIGIAKSCDARQIGSPILEIPCTYLQFVTKLLGSRYFSLK